MTSLGGLRRLVLIMIIVLVLVRLRFVATVVLPLKPWVSVIRLMCGLEVVSDLISVCAVLWSLLLMQRTD